MQLEHNIKINNTSRNQNSKNQKGAITLAARRHNVNVLLSNTTFLVFAVLVA